MKNKLQITNYKLLITALVVISVFVFMAGCVPAKLIKSSDSAIRDKLTSVSDTEYEQWKILLKEGKDSGERSKAAFWCGQYNYNKKNYPEALKYFNYNEKYYADVDWGYLSMLRTFDLLMDTGKKEPAMEKMKLLLEKRHQFSQFEDVAAKRLEEIISAAGREELKTLYAKHYHKMVDEYILYNLCLLDLKEGNYDEFYVHSNAFLIDFRDSAFYADITAKYKESVKYKPVNNKKLAVVIPLTGKSMDIGSLVKTGLEMAAVEFNEGKLPEAKVGFIYIDEEDPKLEQAVIKAIETDGVIAVIGPLYSKTVKTLIPVMERYNTVLFSSTAAQPDLVGKSQYFFRNCATAKGQAYATAKYLIDDTQFRKLACIYSDNAYGKTLNDYFTQRFTASGGEIIRQAAYDPKANDFQDQMVLLGGVNTMLLKEKRSDEKMKLDGLMEDAAKGMMQKVFDYLNITPPDENAVPKPTPDPNMQKVSIAVLHIAPIGDDIKRYQLDDDMTKKISYTMAKSSVLNITKQSVCDGAMDSIGVGAEDLDRELALNVASKLGSEILIWGKIVEAKTETNTANFLPAVEVDKKGNTNVVYNFSDDDYFTYTIKLYAIAVADEAVIDEFDVKFKKVKEPKKNPITLDALYIPATDRKMVLIKDQLRFYDFDIPVFGSSALNSQYITGFKDSMEGVIYPVEFYPEDQDAAVQDFVKKYRDKYAILPDAITAASYDVMKIIGTLLERDITSRENFKTVLSSVRNYQGATGLFSFDSQGDSIKEYYMMKVEKDGIKYLKDVTGE